MGKYTEWANTARAAMDTAGAALTDEQALEAVELFRPWKENESVSTGDRRRDYGILYECVQAHTTQAGWRPAETPALWKVVSVEEWPEWVQPTGAHDAYAKGAKVTHSGKHWTSDIEANTYEPGVYGWTEAA